MAMRLPYIVERVERAGGFASSEDAERALMDAARVLGERLLAIDAGPIADELPPELARFVVGASRGAGFSAEELYREVADREGIDIGIARERVQVVCRELAQVLTGEARDHLTLHAPPDVAALFAGHGAGRAAPARAHPRPRRTRGLSEARPGSRHPLSDARPRGQTHSLAERANPHEDSKLSSGKSSAEEEGDTFSRGRRGSKRPLSDGRS